MAGKKWFLVKKTFNVLGISKTSSRSKSGGDNNSDDDTSQRSEEDPHHRRRKSEDEEVRKPKSQPITTFERDRTRDRKSRKSHDKNDNDPMAKNDRRNESKSDRNLESWNENMEYGDRNHDKDASIARAKARREELKQFKKRTEEDIFLCKSLGMDTNGMCLRHPNQPITILGPTFEEVHVCRICDSESQVGSKAPRQRKSMAGVINQVKAMQANREDWRQRTKVMFWTSKQDLEFDSDDDKALETQFALTQEEWEKQVTARVTQVVAWRDENQLQAHPIFSRYFKMLGMGVPLEAAKNACEMDGYPSGVLDLDPAKSLKSQLGKFDRKARKDLEALADLKLSNDGEENLDVPETVKRVRTSFQKQRDREMLEAVQSLEISNDDSNKNNDEKKKKKNSKEREQEKETEEKEEKIARRAKRDVLKPKKLDSKAKKPRLKETKKKKKAKTTSEGGEVPKKKRVKSTSTEKTKRPTKAASTEKKVKKLKKLNPAKKKRQKAKKVKPLEPIREVDEEDTVGDGGSQAKIDALNLALTEKDKEIESLKQQLRQKDAIIQHLSKRTTTAQKPKSNETLFQSIPSSSNSEHAVIAPTSDDDDEADQNVSNDAAMEFDLKGYDFSTGQSKEVDELQDEAKGNENEKEIPENDVVQEFGEVDWDESIHSASIGDDGNADLDDNASSDSNLLTDDEDNELWRFESSAGAGNDSTPVATILCESIQNDDPQLNEKDENAENSMGSDIESSDDLVSEDGKDERDKIVHDAHNTEEQISNVKPPGGVDIMDYNSEAEPLSGQTSYISQGSLSRGPEPSSPRTFSPVDGRCDEVAGLGVLSNQMDGRPKDVEQDEEFNLLDQAEQSQERGSNTLTQSNRVHDLRTDHSSEAEESDVETEGDKFRDDDASNDDSNEVEKSDDDDDSERNENGMTEHDGESVTEDDEESNYESDDDVDDCEPRHDGDFDENDSDNEEGEDHDGLRATEPLHSEEDQSDQDLDENEEWESDGESYEEEESEEADDEFDHGSNDDVEESEVMCDGQSSPDANVVGNARSQNPVASKTRPTGGGWNKVI